MKPIVSIIMGSTSDLPVVRRGADFLESLAVPFELKALSAHRTPAAVEEFARNAASRGVKVIIAAAGMSAALPGVIAAQTTLPVIGLPISASLMGVDALLSVAQMPPAIPVAAVGVDAALALADEDLAKRYREYCSSLENKILKADAELAAIDSYKFKVD